MRPLKAKFEALARRWGLFSGALDSTPDSTADNNAASSSDNKPSPAYHAEPLGARQKEVHGKKEGHGKEHGHGKGEWPLEVRDGSDIPTSKRVCESAASGTDMLQAIKPHAFHSPPRSHHPGGKGHGEVRDGGGISTPKSVCESVADGTDMLQVENSHAYDSPPRSHQPGGWRRGHDQDCSRSPELVMVWDDGEPPDEYQVLEAAPADQAQELQGRRHLRYAIQTRAVCACKAVIMIC